MKFSNDASPTITNVVMRDCGAFAGGCVMIWPGSPLFVGCSFESSGACGGGGGYCLGGSPEFVNCRFTENTPSQSGGGITISGADNASFTGCYFANNTLLSGGMGGGLDLRRTTAMVYGCTFINNRNYPREGEGGGGTRCVPPEEGKRTGRWEVAGGAISLEDAHATITNCTFIGNSGTRGWRGRHDRVPGVRFLCRNRRLHSRLQCGGRGGRLCHAERLLSVVLLRSLRQHRR